MTDERKLTYPSRPKILRGRSLLTVFFGFSVSDEMNVFPIESNQKYLPQPVFFSNFSGGFYWNTLSHVYHPHAQRPAASRHPNALYMPHNYGHFRRSKSNANACDLKTLPKFLDNANTDACLNRNNYISSHSLRYLEPIFP